KAPSDGTNFWLTFARVHPERFALVLLMLDAAAGQTQDEVGAGRRPRRLKKLLFVNKDSLLHFFTGDPHRWRQHLPKNYEIVGLSMGSLPWEIVLTIRSDELPEVAAGDPVPEVQFF